jgi:hypothetical protein
MKRIFIAFPLVLAAASYAIAQESGNVVFAQGGVPGNGPTTMASFHVATMPPVVGAPYSGTITNQSAETLADGNRIVQTFTGSTARDSQGRTRQDAPLPILGNMSAANSRHLVFIQDPVSQVSYTLDLTSKTAQKITPPPPLGDVGAGPNPSVATSGSAAVVPDKFFVRMEGQIPAEGALPPPMAIGAFLQFDSTKQVTTENLGSQTMEGVLVNGTRTTRTIPAGQIGNEQPINVVTEVWFSPDLKTVVYSKRSDPRTGEQTFRLTNIVRAEPDPSLFTVPADFTVVDGPKPIIYRPTQ